MARGNQDNVDPSAGVDPEDADVWQELERLRTETGGAGAALMRALILKRRADGSKFDRIRSVPLSELDLDQLPVLYGGGDYAIQILNGSRYIKRVSVSYDTDLYPRQGSEARTSATPAPAAPAAPAQGDRLTELMLALQAQRQEDQKRSDRFIETILAGLLSAMKPPDPIAQLTAIKALLGDQANPRRDTPIEVLRDAMRQGMELARGGRDAEDEEGGGNMGRVIEKGLDALGKILENRQAAKPGARPAAAQIPPAAAPPARAVPEKLQPYLWLKGYVGQTIDYARAGFDPERLASALYQMIPETHLDALEIFVRLPSAERRELLAQLDGRLAPYLDYLDQVAVHLVQLFDQEPEDEPDDEPDDGKGEDDTEGDGDAAASGAAVAS